MINIFYMGYQPYFLEMAKILYNENNFTPVYWNSISLIENDIRESYPNCIVHNHYDALKGNPPLLYKNLELEPLCPSLLRDLSLCERIALRMMERNDTYANNFTHRDRVLLYKYFVQYWMTIINKLEPKYIIFEEEPHQANEYILYKVAKLMHIKTIMFTRTTIGKRMYPVNEFEEGSKIIQTEYKKALNDKNNIVLSNEMKKYLETIQGNYNEAISLHLYDQVDNVHSLLKNENKVFKILKNIFTLRLSLKKVKTQIGFLFDFNSNHFKSDQKQYFKSFKNSNLSYFEHVYFKSKSIIKKQFLKRYYNKISENIIDFSIPYVFSAIHYQPEKTTCPLGGDFDDQLYMIELLSKTLPKGWMLYVKEHPSQFVTSYARYGEHFRSYNFYQKILKLKNVKLVSIETDTFKLIDNARAVSTVTSTSAWESVIRGIPSIVFGYSWFNICNGVHYVNNINDLKKLFSEIQKKEYKLDLSEVKCFLNVIEQNTFESVIGGPCIQSHFNVSVESNAQEHVRAIRSMIEV